MGQPPGRKILLADDNPVNRHSLTLLLGKLGHRVDAVTDGVEVLEALREASYDVVVLDLHMPRLDGPEAIRRIREEWSADERPRLVLLTASVAREARDRCMAAGADDFLVKPAEIDRLERSIRGEPEVRSPSESVDGSVLADLQAELGDEDEDVIAELVGLFLTDARRRVDDLRRALAAGDTAAFGAAAHALKGGAGAVGATVLARRCDRCECLAPRDLPRRGPGLLAEVEAELERAREALLSHAG